MNKFPGHQKNESGDDCSNEFDYQENFTQFLEEARKNACQGTSDIANLQAAAGKGHLDGEKKKRKSWKNSLFSWLKTERKNKSTKQPANGTTVSKPRRGSRHVSGPVQGTGGGITAGRAQRALSGLLTSLFRSGRRVDEEYEVPYMFLGQHNNPHKLQSYGPVYLVT